MIKATAILLTNAITPVKNISFFLSVLTALWNICSAVKTNIAPRTPKGIISKITGEAKKQAIINKIKPEIILEPPVLAPNRY